MEDKVILFIVATNGTSEFIVVQAGDHGVEWEASSRRPQIERGVVRNSTIVAGDVFNNVRRVYSNNVDGQYGGGAASYSLFLMRPDGSKVIPRLTLEQQVKVREELAPIFRDILERDLYYKANPMLYLLVSGNDFEAVVEVHADESGGEKSHSAP